MSALYSCLYHGEVIHRRLVPQRHELRYRVYNLFADVDELPMLARRLKLFSRNSINLFSIDDRNHGPGDGTPIREHIWRIAKAARTKTPVQRIFMFCYPSVPGLVFNPLTVYYGFDGSNQLCLTVYEVNNTFGERHSYVFAESDKQQYGCAKVFYVSPFNNVEGDYHFTAEAPADELRLAISLTSASGPCLTACFHGQRRPLTDAALLHSFFSLPMLPFKVIGGIYWEAVKLRLKGLPIQPRPRPPAAPVSIIKKSGSRS